MMRAWEGGRNSFLGVLILTTLEVSVFLLQIVWYCLGFSFQNVHLFSIPFPLIFNVDDFNHRTLQFTENIKRFIFQKFWPFWAVKVFSFNNSVTFYSNSMTYPCLSSKQFLYPMDVFITILRYARYKKNRISVLLYNYDLLC